MLMRMTIARRRERATVRLTCCGCTASQLVRPSRVDAHVTTEGASYCRVCLPAHVPTARNGWLVAPLTEATRVDHHVPATAELIPA